MTPEDKKVQAYLREALQAWNRGSIAIARAYCLEILAIDENQIQARSLLAQLDVTSPSSSTYPAPPERKFNTNNNTPETNIPPSVPAVYPSRTLPHSAVFSQSWEADEAELPLEYDDDFREKTATQKRPPPTAPTPKSTSQNTQAKLHEFLRNVGDPEQAQRLLFEALELASKKQKRRTPPYLHSGVELRKIPNVLSPVGQRSTPPPTKRKRRSTQKNLAFRALTQAPPKVVSPERPPTDDLTPFRETSDYPIVSESNEQIPPFLDGDRDSFSGKRTLAHQETPQHTELPSLPSGTLLPKESPDTSRSRPHVISPRGPQRKTTSSSAFRTQRNTPSMAKLETLAKAFDQALAREFDDGSTRKSGAMEGNREPRKVAEQLETQPRVLERHNVQHVAQTAKEESEPKKPVIEGKSTQRERESPLPFMTQEHDRLRRLAASLDQKLSHLFVEENAPREIEVPTELEHWSEQENESSHDPLALLQGEELTSQTELDPALLDPLSPLLDEVMGEVGNDPASLEKLLADAFLQVIGPEGSDESSKNIESSKEAEEQTLSEEEQVVFEELLQHAIGAYLRQDLKQALDLFSECARISPSDNRILYNLKRLRKRLGDS